MRRVSGAEAVVLEGASVDVPVHPDDVLAQFDEVVKRMPASEVGDPCEFKQALQKVLEHGEPALRDLLQPAGHSTREFSEDQFASMEAVVIANGARPSFLLREGSFAPDHPFLGTWQQELTDYRPTLRRLAGCVGRLQLPNGGPSKFNGTGFLIDANDCLVLTNYHVVVHARNVSGVQMSGTNTKLSVDSDWVIDFNGEVDSVVKNRWRVREVRLPAGFGVSFSGIDAAVLRIEPFDPEESQLPQPIMRLSGDPNYASQESGTTLATIGFPGYPDKTLPAGATVDWNFVIKTLFNDLFGLKRFAPGEFGEGIGKIAVDPLGHVLSHDATTFGGASGSPVFAWKDDGSPAFALHFAGRNAVANYAVSLHSSRAALRAVGAPIT
jgi:serine protease